MVNRRRDCTALEELRGTLDLTSCLTAGRNIVVASPVDYGVSKNRGTMITMSPRKCITNDLRKIRKRSGNATICGAVSGDHSI